MRHYSQKMFAVIAMLFFPGTAFAGPCDAYFAFDGGLEDSSGNGYDGRMIGADGAVAKPKFVEGKRGQALQLDGTSAMRSFIDLHFDTCPQVTVTAWIQVTGTVRKGTQYLVSTGGGSGPGIRISSTSLILNGTANGIHKRDAIRSNAGWMFVAGVYDYATGTYTLYSRNRGVDKELGGNVKAPEDAMWVGAFNDGLAGPAVGILIDDLHIFGTALGKDEIRKLQIGETEKNLVTADLVPVSQPGGFPGESLSRPVSIPDDLLTETLPDLGLSPPSIRDNTITNGPSCSDDSQCKPSNGFTGACYSIAGSTATCYQRCDADSDCSNAYQCLNLAQSNGTLDGVCVAN